ncbi:MAG: TatD family hydrolase [bacterium]
MIDSHTHLDAPAFDGDREEVIARAKVALRCLVNIGCDIPSSERSTELADAHDFIYATVGFHPHEAKAWSDSTYDKLKSAARHPKVVAIGEAGLDYHYENSPAKVQREVFRKMIHLSKEVGLPLVVHSRDAEADTLRILSEERPEGAVMHCFSGGPELARRYIDMGFFISIAGVVTFPKAIKTQEVVRAIPLDRLVIETDAPHLAPIPHRGRRNEPSYVEFVARKIAEIKGCRCEEVSRATSENAVRFYRMKIPPLS